MRQIGLLLTLCPCVALLAQATRPGSAQRSPLAITHVAVIDVATGAERRDQTVLIDSGRIGRIGPAAAMSVPQGARTVDGRGGYLIPGLWDMHTHLVLFGELGMRLMIANGVTGARDMGGFLDRLDGWRTAIGRGTMVGPRIMRAGPVLDDLRGLPGMMGAWRVTVTTPERGRRVVDSLHTVGVDLVKVHSYLPRGAYFGIMTEARRLGMRVGGHLPMSVTLSEAVAAGQRTIEHHWGYAFAASPAADLVRQRLASTYDSLRRAGADESHTLIRLAFVDDSIASAMYVPGRPVAAFRVMGDHHVYSCPTLATLNAVARANEPEVAHDARARYIPRSLLGELDPGDPKPNPTAADIAYGRRRMARWVAMFRDMHAQGVPFLAGTDMGVLGVFPGFSLHDELALLVQVGLTPLEALQAATRNAAESLDASNRMGTIATRAFADLVLLDADPLVDIRNSRRIRAVIAGGRLFARADLDALLAGAEREARSDTSSTARPR